MALSAAAGCAKHLDFATAVVAQFDGRVGNADEPRIAKHRRRAVGQLEVQPPAQHDNDIGLRPSRCRASRPPPTGARR
jgi:hypothetical protein